MNTTAPFEKVPVRHEPKWFDVVKECTGTMRFGTVQIVVHEGRVMQVEATHRTRFDAELAASPRK